jgi:hypothetical protein
MEPQIRSYVRYDDNFQLRFEDENSVWEGAVEPKVTLARRTARSQLAGSAAVNARRFDENDLNTEDIRLDLRSFYALERARLGLNASFIKDTTLDSTLEETGVVYQRDDRRSVRLSPNWTYNLTERTLLSASLDYSKVEYDDTDETGLADYDYRAGSLGSEFRWTEKTSLNVYTSYGRYQRDDDLLKSDNTQVSAGFAHEVSERFDVRASAGYRHTETNTRSGFPVCSGGVTLSVGLAELLGIDTSLARNGAVCVDPGTLAPLPFSEGGTTDSSNGFLFNGGLNYRFETGTVSMAASRNILPSARDGLLVTDRVTLAADRRLTETLTASLRVSWYQTDSTSDAPSQTDRELIRVRPGIRWQLARDWAFGASYRYTRSDYEEVSESAESHMAEATLTYRWPKIAVSR